MLQGFTLQLNSGGKITKTIKFSATIGIVAGYSGNKMLRAAKKVAPDAMAKAWQKAAAEVQQDTGVYVSAVIYDTWALYHTDWGCPHGGEPTHTIEGSLNPKFGEETSWREAVIAVVKKVKEAFKQSTVTVVFSEVDQEYLD